MTVQQRKSRKWPEEEEKITCEDRYPSAMKTIRKRVGYFCLNNKKMYRRDDPTVKVRPIVKLELDDSRP